MTLTSKRRRIGIRSGWKLGDSLEEGTRTLIYGIGMFFLIAAVIIGASSMVYGLAIGNPASFMNWGIVSVVLLLIGIVMKMAGTKIKGGN